MVKKLKILYPGGTEKSVILFTNDENYSSKKIAAFDIDWTIIRPTSGIFVNEPSDLVLWNPKIPEKLSQLIENGFKIVFFSNQAGLQTGKRKLDVLSEIIETLVTKIQLEKIQIFISAAINHYRKPSTLLWKLMEKNYNNGVEIDIKSSFYVGDAAGRLKNWKMGAKKDFSVSDRKFAANLGVKFYTPDVFFLGSSQTDKWNWNSFDFKKFAEKARESPLKEEAIEKKIENSDCLVILVGAMGSGKSTFASKLKGFEVISNVEYKTHKRCVSALSKILKTGKRKIVIDNTNPTKSKRNDFINICKQHSLDYKIVYFDVKKELAAHLNICREIKSKGEVKKVPAVARNKFYKSLQVPRGKNVIKIAFTPKFDNSEDEQIFMNWT